MKKVVTWKDEGDCGPCKIYDDPAEVHKARVFGAPLPDSIQDKGWQTRADAKKLAKKIGADFQEF